MKVMLEMNMWFLFSLNGLCKVLPPDGLVAIAQELLHGPLDGEVTEVRVVLPDADEEYGHVGGVDEGDEGADHIADGVALGDDEAVEGADGAEGGVEVAGLGDRVCAHECLLVFVVSRLDL